MAQNVGKVIWFNREGFGFIAWADAAGTPQKDMFVHYSGIEQEGFRTLKKDDEVTFDVGTNNRGEPIAVAVVRTKEAPPAPRTPRTGGGERRGHDD